MCDCYEHECAVEWCQKTIPMHIGDFAFPREDFMVWCQEHAHYAHPGAVIFTVTKTYASYPDPGPEDTPGWQCAILGPNVGGSGDNHPNIAAECSEETVE